MFITLVEYPKETFMAISLLMSPLEGLIARISGFVEYLMSVGFLAVSEMKL